MTAANVLDTIVESGGGATIELLTREFARFGFHITEQEMVGAMDESLRAFPDSDELAWNYLGKLLEQFRSGRY